MTIERTISLTSEQANYLVGLIEEDRDALAAENLHPGLNNMVDDIHDMLTADVYLNAAGKPVVHTVDDVRKFIQLYPEHLMMMPWHQMIHDMDHCGEEYAMNDFWKEMVQQYVG